MQDKRSGSIPYDEIRPVEAAIVFLLVAEDYPWWLRELGERVGCPADVIRICVGRLQADGLLVRDGETVRASWAAIRLDELGGWRELASGRGGNVGPCPQRDTTRTTATRQTRGSRKCG
ncbi:MAG: hypothetical protein ABSH36_01895 [Solirubrobacteraceae bacterium]|jgi:hypothetical protein